MFQLWALEDFASQERRSEAILDHWEPPRLPASKLHVSGHKGEAVNDFWDPIETLASTTAPHRFGDDWSDSALLPLFRAGAAENPFLPKPEIGRKQRLTSNRARWLLSLLDVAAESTRKRYLRAFEEMFEMFPHASSFRALSELALGEVSAEDILAAFQLRLLWRESPKFWSIRAKGIRAPLIPAQGENMLGWTRATRLVQLSKGIAAECIIDEDWYEEWLSLPVGDPAYWYFLDYITIRLEAFSAGALDLPRELRRLDETQWRGLVGISLDGIALGSAARAAHLVRFETDQWTRSLGI